MPHPTVVKFIEENGTDRVVDPSENFWIFSNGAYLEYGNQWGVMVPAFAKGDKDDIEGRLSNRTQRNKLYYHQVKLGRAIRAFETCKAELEQRAKDAYNGHATPPNAGEIDRLYELKVEIEKFEKMVNQIEIEIHPPPKVVPLTAADIATREKSQAVLQTIRSIEV